jgi:tetratricopeptide (TPR) repeat protein
MLNMLFRTLFALATSLFAVTFAAPPQEADALLASAKVAMRQKDAPRAAGLLEKAVAIRPDSAEIHYRLGSAYASIAATANPFKQASMAGKFKAEMESAVQLDANYIDARMRLVDFYMMAPGLMGGSETKALEQAAAIRQRDSFQGHRAFARIYIRQKNFDLARKEYVDAVREQPTSARAHTALGTFVATNDKNYRGAFDEIEKALQLDAAYMPAWFRIGQVAALSGTNHARGEEALKKYLAYDAKDDEPEISTAHYHLGQIYESQGRKAEARQSYATALRLSPGTKTYEESLKRVSD